MSSPLVPFLENGFRFMVSPFLGGTEDLPNDHLKGARHMQLRTVPWAFCCNQSEGNVGPFCGVWGLRRSYHAPVAPRRGGKVNDPDQPLGPVRFHAPELAVQPQELALLGREPVEAVDAAERKGERTADQVAGVWVVDAAHLSRRMLRT